jgi:RNA-directed DNA polymerase
LLSNIMLDDLDRELAARGLVFCRYADDIRVFVVSKRAAERVMGSVSEFIERRLKLRVNRGKSSVQPAGRATMLGFGFTWKRGGKVGIRLARRSKERLRQRLKELTGRSWSVSMAYRIGRLNSFIIGWLGYFRIAECESELRSVDKWLRRRLRQVRWKEWKKIAAKLSNLIALGIRRHQAWQWANSSKGYWRIADSWVLHRTLTNEYWSDLGLKSLLGTYRRFRSRTA